MTDKIVVLVTAASLRESKKIAKHLVDARLAACVNITQPIQSIYRWQGKVAADKEFLLLIKSSRELFEEIKATVAKLHSYTTPEIICLPIVDGSEEYLQWIDDSVKQPGEPHSHPLSPAEKDAALRNFLLTRSGIEDLSVPAQSGVYAIYVRSRGLLMPFAERENGLIYIGVSTNLADREFEQHFSLENTGFSTLRRSLGAILKSQLTLQAIPRAPGSSESNVRNYCFLRDGETRLTDWMREHLQVGVHASSRYLDLENFLVPELKPLLNLNKWPNPNSAAIKRLRKVCADEARQARHTIP